ncbi:MAG TPA: SAM-dependent methyltransferase [Candidatus Limnocylindrales bacterium]
MTEFGAELRRDPPADLDVPGDPALIARIRAEIEAHGPMTFARFMELALYEPELGYYRTPSLRPGRTGDFLTAPESHPIFGRMVSRQLDEVWRVLDRPDPFVVREHGAGGGALAEAIVGGLAAERSALLDAVRYQPVEIDDRRFAAVAERVAGSGFPGIVEAPRRGAVVGAVVANEVLDALPVHRFIWRGGRLREVYVAIDGDRFVDHVDEPSTPDLAARLTSEGVELAEGQRGEISLALDGWIANAGAELDRGLVLLVDYGHPAAELYGARRANGTLMGYLRHRARDDPYASVGRQDLTAHVDITAVTRAAIRAGLSVVGSTKQAEFLVGLGIGDVLAEVQRDPGTTMDDYLPLRSAVMRLLDPGITGGFRVLGFGGGLPTGVQLRGFSYRLERPGARPGP